MSSILITGGAGFVGSSLALKFKAGDPERRVVAFDNLRRRGSELALPRLREEGIEFVHGDVRQRDDLAQVRDLDLIIDCAAEPSVLAGQDDPCYVVETNLGGTLNSLELARREEADFVFLSTSRVYPSSRINDLSFEECDTRWTLASGQTSRGASPLGINEDFSLDGPRSFYGASKLASELLVQEYVDAYGLRAIIDRCGVLTGPWQMGKVDQGFVVLWAARHLFGGELSYIGYGGKGKQVRDVLHVDDLFRLLELQLDEISTLTGEVFNIGGGARNATSLSELTALCRRMTGNEIPIHSVDEPRAQDVLVYLTDYSKATNALGWEPLVDFEEIVEGVLVWLSKHREQLLPILGGQ